MFNYLTIERSDDEGGYWLCGHGEYECGSVLEGQPMFSRLDLLNSIADAHVIAAAEYPGVPCEVCEYATGPVAVVPDLPPADFDPADCGEEW